MENNTEPIVFDKLVWVETAYQLYLLVCPEVIGRFYMRRFKLGWTICNTHTQLSEHFDNEQLADAWMQKYIRGRTRDLLKERISVNDELIGFLSELHS